MISAQRSKYNVDKDKDKRTYNDIVFDSVLEMKFYRDVICPNVESGSIKNCEMQVAYELQPKFEHDGKKVKAITYVADFVITDKDDNVIVIDTKGMPDSVSKIKRKMFWYIFPDINYKWIGYSKIDGGWVDYEDIKKGRAARKKVKKEGK